MKYTVGDQARIKGVCMCAAVLLTSGPIAAGRESSICWHGPKTTIRRVFANGRLLLENSYGFVRAAKPEEING